MKPDNHEIIDALSSEYVLGTLRGPARRRFERWRTSNALVDQRCRFWEERLMRLAIRLAPLQPPARVWLAIQRRLNLTPSRSALRRTRSFALAASVLLVVGLTALLYWRGHQTIRATVVATISAKAGGHIWELEVFGNTQRLVVHAVQLPDRPAGRDYELWALPKGGSPVSLGVLPNRDVSSRTLSAMQKQALANSSEVAVTLEPHGGSPTGQPTGDVLYVAPLRAAS
jgi:anti-sigma-K factor RskA